MAKDKRAKDEDVREEEEAHEEEEIEEEEKDEKKDKKELKRLKEDKKAMDARLGKLESTMDALIKALDKKAKDSDEEDDEKWLKKDEDEDETMDEASEEKREKEEKEAKDAALKLIKTLKPAIINLPVADQAAPKAMLRNLLNFVKGGVAKDSTTYSDVIGAISSNGRNQNKKPVGDSAPAEAFSEKLENVRKTRNATELAKAKLAGK